jgi:integrase
MGRRQFGSVRRLPSGRWQASYWHAGRRHIAEVTLMTKADANAYLAAAETQIRRGAWIDPWAARMRFADWAEEWRASIVDLRPSTKARDLGYLERYVLPRFGELELGQIDHMAIRAWVAELSASGLAPATTTKAAQLLGKIMKSAVQAGLLLKSPGDGVRLPRIERVEMRFLDASDVRALAAAIDPRYKAAVLLAAYGGLRAGELFGLRAKRVDPLRRTVTIAETLVDVGGHPYFGPPKTRAGHRTIPLPRVAADPLAEHLAAYGRKPDDLVFTAPEGGPVQLNVWRRRFWAPAVRGAGLDHLRPHDLRHTAVALWIAAGANPKEAATRAGHTSVSFTLDRYGHLFPGSEQRLNDALDLLAGEADAEADGGPNEGPAGPENEPRARKRSQNPVSIAHVARTPESDTVSDANPQLSDQGKEGGRCGTRTHDLSRVKAA